MSTNVIPPAPVESYFHGRVIKRSLPLVHGRPGPDAPRLKRLLLPQGELAQFWDGPEPIYYMAFLELREGTIRGNHYHNNKREFFYVISGVVAVCLAAVDSDARQTINLGAGDMVDIGTGMAHAYKTEKSGAALEFSNALFDAEDVKPFSLI